MQHKIDAIVCGVGSGGTLTGLGRYFSKTSPNVEMILADPKGSVLAPFLKTGKMIEAGNWLVEGIGEDFIPDNCEMKFIKDAYSITDAESIATSREVLIKEGIMCGSSSGTLIAAALKYCRSQKEPKRVVSFVCDSGNKYLSKVYNEYWLEDYGFTDRVEKHDLTDLISRPYGKGSAIVIRPEDTLQKAYRKMKTYDVSQLPVINGDRSLGIVDESDILMAAMGNPAGFNIKASEAMAKNLVTLDIKSPIDKLLPIFDKGMVAIITDNDKFVGIVTKIDLLQHLRKRSAK